MIGLPHYVEVKQEYLMKGGCIGEGGMAGIRNAGCGAIVVTQGCLWEGRDSRGSRGKDSA